MVTQLQPDVRAYLHGGEVIKRYIKVEEVAYEYGFSVEETEYIAKAASSLYKLTRIHLVKKERLPYSVNEKGNTYEKQNLYCHNLCFQHCICRQLRFSHQALLRLCKAG